jgi:non-heme chloroperoxidase
MAITKYEQPQVEKANATGRTPVVFIHGLWLLPSSWDRWAEVFEQAGYAPLTPWTEAKVKSKNPERGPLLIVNGEKDHTVPLAIARASYDKQKRNEGVTEFVEIPGRGHALTIDSGWREVADTALAFVKRFA